jgi:hypothetical protein
MNDARSWPERAEISDSSRAGIVVTSMWSTVTFTPTLRPHSSAKRSNHLSWRGTKWLQTRIFSSPESFFDGSANVSPGAPASVALVPPSPLSEPPQPASTSVAAVPWMNLRRVITNGLPRSLIVALPVSLVERPRR